MKALSYSADEWLSLSVKAKLNTGHALLNTMPVLGAKITLMRKMGHGVVPSQATVIDILPSSKRPDDQLYVLEIQGERDVIKYYGQSNWIFTGSVAECKHHQAIENGMARSWCKHCDVDMDWSPDHGFLPRGAHV